MAQTDRTAFIGNTGIKKPVKAATTANIVLSGEQTIDGVACVSGERVLVKSQTDGVDNGIYDVDTGAWSRSRDFDGVYAAVKGTLVFVNPGGAANGDGLFRVATEDSITIGETSLSFVRENINYTTNVQFTSAAGQTVFDLGVSYQTGSNALQVFVNGLRVRDYTETTSTRITFNYALAAGDEVDLYIGVGAGQITAAAASQSAVTDAGDYYVGVTVEAVLQEIATAVGADNGDADAAFTNGASARIQRWNTAFTANRTFTLNAANAKEGAKAIAVRQAGATGNYTLDVGGLATLRAPGEWALCAYDMATAAWVLIMTGLLPSAEVRAISADNGDASVNLTVGSSERTQRWASALTAERTADLQATRAHNGARFRVERLESATGGFALSVLTGATVLARLASGQWCEAEYTGTAWIVVAFGNLRRKNTALVELFDDFLGEEVDGFRWQSLIGTDASCRQAIVRADQVGGVARLTTGANAGATMALNGAQLHSQLNWNSNKGVFEWEGRVALDAITAVALFVGLTDQRAALEMPFTLAAGDALTSNATDAVGVLFDTGADTDNWWLVGVKADIDAVKQNTAVAPVAATFETWRIEIDANGQASFYRNGTLIGVAMAAAVTPSASLTPVVAAFSRGAASRNVDIDFLEVQAQR